MTASTARTARTARAAPAPADTAGPGRPAHPAGKPLEEFALRLGDDALIMWHRLTEWLTRAPELDDEVALANIALDLLGQARSLLTVAGRSSDRGEDELAFARPAEQFRNALMAELPNGDFADTVVRLLLFSTYQSLWYTALAESADPELAALAARSSAEAADHRRYAETRTVRLGTETTHGHERMLDALTDLWPFAAELFAQDELIDQLTADGLVPDPAPVHGRWLEQVTDVLVDATLGPPPGGTWRPAGGRAGVHTEALTQLLAEMQSAYRARSGAAW